MIEEVRQTDEDHSYQVADGNSESLSEIDFEGWQNAIDLAFDQEDYETIETIRRVQPSLTPSPDKVNERIEVLLATKPLGWTSKLQSLNFSCNGCLNKHPKVVEEINRLFDLFGREQKNLDQLRSLLISSDARLSKEQVQLKYKTIVNGEHSLQWQARDLIDDIQKLTGVAPEASVFQNAIRKGNVKNVTDLASNFGILISDEMVQAAYEKQYALHVRIDVDFIRETGVLPSGTLTRKIYDKLIEEGDMESIKQLQDVTGVVCHFTPEAVQPLYERYIKPHIHPNDGEKIRDIIALSGIKPAPELVCRVALRCLEYYDAQRDIQTIETIAGVPVQFSDEMIQDLYQRAISQDKLDKILLLFEVTKTRPRLDPESARQFILQRLGNLSPKQIEALENIFEIDFLAQPDEVNQIYRVALEQLDFQQVERVKQITGLIPDQSQLQIAFEHRILQLLNGVNRGGIDWSNIAVELLKTYPVQINDSLRRRMYESASQRLSVIDIEKINQITGQHLPPDLAQDAYVQLLSSTQWDSSATFKKIFDLSNGVIPIIPHDQIQRYYQSRLLGRRVDSAGIDVIARLTGVEPQFNASNIREIYQQKIVEGDVHHIQQIAGITHVPFEVDQYVQQLAKERIARELHDVVTDEHFSRTSSGPTVVKLKEMAEVELGIDDVQKYYDQILETNPGSWTDRIDAISSMTGILPQFNSEQLSTKALSCIQTGKTVNLRVLATFGEIRLEGSDISDGYETLLMSVKDERGKYHRDWLSAFLHVSSITGVRPRPRQLGKIAAHLLRDNQYFGRRHPSDIDLIQFLQTSFGVSLDSSQTSQICGLLLEQDEYDAVKYIIQNIGEVPVISEEDLKRSCDAAISEGKLSKILQFCTVLQREQVPVSSEVLQKRYQLLASNPEFGSFKARNITSEFYQLFDLTGQRPVLTPSQLSSLYRNIMRESRSGDFADFERVVGVPPTNEDLQHQVYFWMDGDLLAMKSRLLAFIERHNVLIDSQLVNDAAMSRLKRTSLDERSASLYNTIDYFKELESLVHQKIQLPGDEVRKQIIRLLISHQSDLSSQWNPRTSQPEVAYADGKKAHQINRH